LTAAIEIARAARFVQAADVTRALGSANGSACAAQSGASGPGGIGRWAR